MNFQTVGELDQVYEAQTLKSELGLTDDVFVEFSTKDGVTVLAIGHEGRYKYTVRKFRGSLWLVAEDGGGIILWKRKPLTEAESNETSMSITLMEKVVN